MSHNDRAQSVSEWFQVKDIDAFKAEFKHHKGLKIFTAGDDVQLCVEDQYWPETIFDADLQEWKFVDILDVIQPHLAPGEFAILYHSLLKDLDICAEVRGVNSNGVKYRKTLCDLYFDAREVLEGGEE